jgi:hypothetical protein
MNEEFTPEQKEAIASAKARLAAQVATAPVAPAEKSLMSQAPGMAADIGLEAGGATVGQLVGSRLGLPGVIAGGFAGGAGGNALAQLRQIGAGERSKFSIPEVIGSGASSMFPGGSLAKASTKTIAKEVAKQSSAQLGGMAIESIGERGDLSKITVPQAIVTFLGTTAGIGGAALIDMGKKVQKQLIAKADKAVRDKTLEEARKEGYIILPSSLGKSAIVTDALEFIAGKSATMADIVERNDSVTKSLAKRAIGIPLTETLDTAALEGVRKEAGKVYAEAASVSNKASKALDDFKLARDQARAFFIEYERGNQVVALKEAKKYQAKADKYWSVIKDESTQAGKADLIDRLEHSKVLIAKTHLIEDAYNTGAGTVAADIISRRRKYGQAIPTGELKIIADFAEAFPRASDEAIEKSATAIVRPLAMAAVPVVGYGLSGNPATVATLAASTLFAPSASRSVLTSDLYQKLMATPKYNVQVPQDLGAILAQMGGMATGRQVSNLLPPGEKNMFLKKNPNQPAPRQQ